MKLRRFLRSLLGAAALCGTAAAPSLAEDPLVTNVSRFEIPFDVESTAGQSVDGFAVLFGSTDGGNSWEQLQSVPVASQGFPFAAPRDGLYAFAVRMTDAAGHLIAPQAGATPELQILVDTVAPELSLDVDPAGSAEALVRWHTPDSSAQSSSLVLEYSDSVDGVWRRIPVTPSTSGQTTIHADPGTAVSVRAAIVDAAGNRGEASAQLVLSPVANDAAKEGTSAGTLPMTGAPLGPSPFETGAAAASPPFAPVPQVPQAVQLKPPARQPAVPRAADSTTSVSATASQPAPKAAQLISSHVFDMSYQVDDVGPSGVSSVELFVTEDGGRQWFRYGNDADLRSPVQVDVQGEGTFGFAVRVRNGLGLADPPPQPGDSPDIVVQVDETAPQLQFDEPRVRPDGSGTLSLSWDITDTNPASLPVRLEKSVSPSGPWAPVFDWQVDKGSFEWVIKPGTPSSLYFRLLGRDAAGNVASATTPQPVLIDLKRPVARLIGAQVSRAPAVRTRFE